MGNSLEGRRIVGVFAHPDDETYMLGGCFARYREEGVVGTVLSFTRGEAGQIGGGSDATVETLGEVREAELRSACALFGVADVRVLGTPDGGTVHTEEGVTAIEDVLRELKPDILVCMEPHGVTNHPDHIAVSTMTHEAFERVKDEGYPKKFYLGGPPQAALAALTHALEQNGIEWLKPGDPFYPVPTPDHLVACVVDVMPWVEVKIAALKAHMTQSDEMVNWFPREASATFFGAEAFQRVAPPRVKGTPAENDLFEGLR